MIIPKLEIRGSYMKDRKILPVWYVGEQLPQSFIRRKTRKSVNSPKYANESDVADDADANDEDDDYIPRKKGVRFVLSHNKFGYFLVTMFLALIICLCIYSLHY